MTSPEPRLRILVVHGPNLNLLGAREPSVYGTTTLEAIDAALRRLGEALAVQVDCRQSNHEGVIIDWIHEAREHYDGLLLNPGGYTHGSVAIRDAVAGTGVPAVEVHLSNLLAREGFRGRSRVAAACIGLVAGFGPASYELGLRGLVDYVRSRQPAERRVRSGA